MLKLAEKVVLTEQQQAVIDWVVNGTGSLELLARAGCGKTFTLMKVVDAIVKNNLGDVAVMAYNKKIADELKQKLELSGYDWRTAQAGTVHSFGYAAWRKVAPGVKIDNNKVDQIILELSFGVGGSFFIQNATAIGKLVSLAKQRAIGYLCPLDDIHQWVDIWDHFDIDDEVLEDVSRTEVISAALQVYRTSLNKCRDVIDFDDMILAPLYFRAKFWPKSWILVDESQDTNPARRALALAMLKPRTGRMVFVGDPAQAIYGFTGADSDSMNQLRLATNAKTLPLNVTRRCPKAVVKEAQRLVPDFKAWDGAIEGNVRAIEFKDLTAEPLTANDAILCRNTAPLISIAYMLIGAGRACIVEGREIGTGLIKLARNWKVKDLAALKKKLEAHEERLTAKYSAMGRMDKVERLKDQVDCLRIIIESCQAKKKNSVDDVVAEITNMFGNTPEGERPKVLTLSTVHKSKGREWERVYIYGRARYMPSPYAKKDWQMEQETNLEYVAITRALQELIDVSVM